MIRSANDKKNDIIYVERLNNPYVNKLIRENIAEFTKLFDTHGKRFVYLPEIFSYNMPTADIDISHIYREMAAKAGAVIIRQGLLFAEKWKGEIYYEIKAYDYWNLRREIESILQEDVYEQCCMDMPFDSSKEKATEKTDDKKKESDKLVTSVVMHDRPLFRITGNEDFIDDEDVSDISFCIRSGEEKEYIKQEEEKKKSFLKGILEKKKANREGRNIMASSPKNKKTVINEFLSSVFSEDDNKEEIDRISVEIKERIDRLKELGVDYMSLLNIVEERPKLSRLVITENYHIVLPDYGNMEVDMRPMAKALYFLFLRHPEGIAFKDLPDHREELRKIYGKISNLSSGRAQIASVEAVTDPLQNTVNVNCSRIREAFFGKFREEMAMQYVINGKRGEAKKVNLEQNMIEWQCKF